MSTRRSAVRNTLRILAQTPVEPPPTEFIDGLDRQLRGLADAEGPPPPSNVVAFRRRVSRGAAIGIVAGVMSAAGAAAVAIVTVRHADGPPPATTTTTTTTVHPPSSTDPVRPAPPTKPSTVPTSTVPTSTVPTSTVPTAPPIADASATATVATTVSLAPQSSSNPAATAPPEAVPTEPTRVVATPPPSTTTTPTAATTSTEVQVPASIELTCIPTGAAAISCSWSTVPPGTDHVIVLRSTPSDARGRVLFPDSGAASITDSTVAAGTTYTYLIHAMDASNHSLAHSNAVTISCCS